jgi:uncharacterized protein (UPF0371 family)
VDTTIKNEIVKYLKALAVGMAIGFGVGTIATNISYTYHLQKDCETMKQFRVGSLAYKCEVK